MVMKNLRTNIIFCIFILFSFLLLSRLFYVQIIQKDFYKALAQGLYNSDTQTESKRGEIFFKDNEPLAINKNWPLVFACPPKVVEKEKTARILSEKLSLDKNFVLEKLKKDSLYSLLKDKLNQEEAEVLKNLNLPGIYSTATQGRYYPQDSLASQTIGFLGADNNGQYGLEEYYNDVLENSDIVLTLDYKVQFMAEKLLSQAKENLDIEAGQIIVIEPVSGKIVALANFPNFNPNQYNKYAQQGNLNIFQNSNTQKLFEPGSVFKPITFAAALNEEKITPLTTYIDKGVVKIGGWPIYNYEKKVYPGAITMTEVLEKSINTGAVFVEKKLSHNMFLDYVDRFGIFEATGIDLSETYSENEEFKKGYEINFATASFGQGIMMTPIQLIRAYCAIANGGELVKPYLVEDVGVRPQHSQVISSKTSRQLTTMLISVVDNGFAKTAQVPGYYIAGKTGTAQVAFSALGIDKRGYSEKTIQTFVGWVGGFNPDFLILVKLDNPKTKTAEYSAVPVFHDLVEYIIHYYQIPPDREQNETP